MAGARARAAVAAAHRRAATRVRRTSMFRFDLIGCHWWGRATARGVTFALKWRVIRQERRRSRRWSGAPPAVQGKDDQSYPRGRAMRPERRRPGAGRNDGNGDAL